MAQYAQILSITAPEAAASGERVDIQVSIKNLYSAPVTMMAGGALEYGASPWPGITFPNPTQTIYAGQSAIFSGYFTMPNRETTIHAYSYWYGEGSYHFDDEKTKKIGAWVPLATRNITVRRAGAGAWVPLATRSLFVRKAAAGAWVKLASRTILVKMAVVGGWVPLATRSIQVQMAMVGGWVPLALKTVRVSAGTSTGQDVFKTLTVDFEKKAPAGVA